MIFSFQKKTTHFWLWLGLCELWWATDYDLFFPTKWRAKDRNKVGVVRTKQLTAMEKQRGTEGFVELKREFGGVQGPKIPLSLHDTLRTLAGKIHVKDLGSGVDVVAWSAVMSACDKGGEYLGWSHRGSVDPH